MTGKDNGVTTGFKQLENFNGTLSVHCICHRLAFICGDTGGNLKFLSDFETTMIQLWKFLKYSPKRLKTYIKTAMRLQEFEDLPQAQQRPLVQKVKKAARTRWLSLDGVEAFYKEYPYLLHALRSMKDEEGSSTGAATAGMLKKDDDMEFLSVLCVLKLLLSYLSTLSKTFQSGMLNFSRIKPAIEKITHKIKDLAEK